MFIGTEIANDPRLSTMERLYIRILGVPINGLRIRARRVLPSVPEPCNRILDAGCGIGVFSLEMAKRFPEASVVAIDMNEDQIKANATVADRSGIKNVEFKVADATALEFDSEFDFILSVDVIEHVENDLAVCRSIHRALAPGGRLLMHIPALTRWWVFFGRRENFTHEKGHVRPGYSPETIQGLLVDAGFIVDDAHYTYGWLETVTNNVANIISRGDKRNKVLYAIAFPMLLFISYWGQFSIPKKGSGVLVKAHKPNATDPTARGTG